jgi:methyl-accepting chemotaxis protein
MSLRRKVAIAVSGVGVLAATTISIYSYRSGIESTREDGRRQADELMARTIQMFAIPSKTFDSEFRSAATPDEKMKVLTDWTRTFSSVDAASIHDFGPGVTRVRLVGDERLGGYRPLGGDAVKIQIPFEEEAIRKFRSGAKIHTAEEPGLIRVAAPLWSDAHEGCGACHIGLSEGLETDLTKRILLGTLNVYVPLDQRLAAARRQGMIEIGAVIAAFAVVIIAVILVLNRLLIRPVSAIAESVDTAADQVCAGAAQMAATSQQFARSASEQATTLEEVSSSAEEINSMALQNSTHSVQASQSVNASEGRFELTASRLSELTAAMHEISESSGKVARIIRVIDEIAFQTNILALNAAVEAARAGEAGMGFAVVADEVRTLAQRCAQAARETSALIEESVSKSQEGKGKLDAVSEVVIELSEQFRDVKRLIDDVHTGSGEQATGIAQIARAVAEMQGTVQSTAASAEEGAAAAEEFNSQAALLKSSVEQLRAIIA